MNEKNLYLNFIYLIIFIKIRSLLLRIFGKLNNIFHNYCFFLNFIKLLTHITSLKKRKKLKDDYFYRDKRYSICFKIIIS